MPIEHWCWKSTYECGLKCVTPLVHLCAGCTTSEYKTQPHHSCFRPGSLLGSTPVCTNPSEWSSCCHGNHRSASAGTVTSWHWRRSRWGLRRTAWSPLVDHTGSHQALPSLLGEDRQESDIIRADSTWEISLVFKFTLILRNIPTSNGSVGTKVCTRQRICGD